MKGKFLCKGLIGTVAILLLFAGAAYALPSLQLGPGSVGTWSYDTGSQTWFVSGNPFELNAYANATKAEGGHGKYAWDVVPDPTQTAYLVASAVPMTGTDDFDITVKNDSSPLSVFGSGYGTPPVSDPHALAPHGVYPTYFEIYQFDFDGSRGTIYDTQPGQAGSGQGYSEIFNININSLAAGVAGVHFDLFTMSEGQVMAFAPWSHDAQTAPEPATMLLLGTGLIGLAGFRKKFRKN